MIGEGSRERSQPGWSADARVKLILMLGLILSIGLAPMGAWPAYILYFSAVLSAALAARQPLRALLKRGLLALPFVLAAAPLLFSRAGTQLDVNLGGAVHFSISLEGTVRFASIAIKSYLSVLAAVLFTAVTPVQDVSGALYWLRVPPTLVATAGLMLRYLGVLRSEAERLLRARASRSSRLLESGGQNPGVQPERRPGGSLMWRARVTGGMAGSLLLRSIERSERIYAAMMARGYNGTPPFYRRRPLGERARTVLGVGLIIELALLLAAILTGGI